MKPTLVIILVLTSTLVLGFQESATLLKPSPKKEIILDAYKQIKDYHSNVTSANNVVKVVYFQGNDTEPLSNWKERLTRTLDRKSVV
jgi:hypothetical protein